MIEAFLGKRQEAGSQEGGGYSLTHARRQAGSACPAALRVPAPADATQGPIRHPLPAKTAARKRLRSSRAPRGLAAGRRGKGVGVAGYWHGICLPPNPSEPSRNPPYSPLRVARRTEGRFSPPKTGTPCPAQTPCAVTTEW